MPIARAFRAALECLISASGTVGPLFISPQFRFHDRVNFAHRGPRCLVGPPSYSDPFSSRSVSQNGTERYAAVSPVRVCLFNSVCTDASARKLDRLGGGE